MRSGISHLRKKNEADQHNEHGLKLVGEGPSGAEELPVCELDDPIWSVVSFDQREAGGLTYAQAVHLIAELDVCGIAGLCIITDTAAANINSGQAEK